ncbi:unnamed protein product [Owenia fusiformis]|uniref:Uncharacterized protein n=1 Tax=Owenia fusiformis TaxID=6347 RepID=A0A8S4P241_OWEFU|nr:unnamed protein product [Owenia fusiformis]
MIYRMVEKTHQSMSCDGTRIQSCEQARTLDHNPHRRMIENQTIPMISDDNARELPNVCAACGGQIQDRYYLMAMEKQWHMQCLRCCECKLRLDSDITCFWRDGNVYCKEDYYRRYGVKRCARCHIGISSDEMVMRAKDLVYHLSCFTCTSCNKTLSTGEHFGMRDSIIFCREHYEMSLQGEFIPNISPNLPGGAQGQMPFYNGVGAVQKGRPRKRKSPMPDPMDDVTSLCDYGMDSDMHDLSDSTYSSSRQKRMRTSFKHHQLRTMKSYFNLNHNPDAKDLKQLAQKTGLTKRVLQVWFQNARAKYRRNLLRQESGEGNNNNNSKNDGQLSSSEMGSPGSNAMADLSNSRSPALSDISSTPSLSDLQSGTMDHMDSMDTIDRLSRLEHDQSSSLTDIFHNSLNPDAY